MTKEIQIGSVKIGGRNPLGLIAGPCVIESKELCYQVAREAKSVCDELGMPYIFKGSFDKANRLSISSPRGPGMEEGLEILAEMRSNLGIPLLTDVHEVCQVSEAAQVVDILQIPAFLCRQTDLVLAAANTGKPVNIKKGQFLAPNDMLNIVEKAKSTGNEQILLTERGVSFGYGNLIVDMRSLAIMREFGFPVAFDATHSVQRPGGLGTASGGDREYVPHLVRAACAVGIDALFLEVHPNPASALSDAATMLPLDSLRSVLAQAQAIDALVRGQYIR
ncbi:MAG TPA: 3-deoxy-8-phosphooctulonate synthase [Armatimonadota bacterium]|nr:3-deoxy-8-phosphooctulonate synthase [Armatimonadota bacterium]